ncbi:MAG: Gfo/Idh/MocA family oxidoreductase [Planctomycetota bacterium]
MNDAHDNPPARIGLVGLAGYSGKIADTLSQLSKDPASGLRFSDLFVPDPDPVHERLQSLQSQGVKRHHSYEALLQSGIDAVWLPVPIHLHRPMTETALAARVTVMCEKPVAGSLEDAAAMVRARDRADRAVLIGYQNLFEPATQRLKEWLLETAHGQPLRVTVTGCWPRGEAYYERNEWAGKNRHGEHWVRDSPANNAMAHFLNLAMFLLGHDATTSALPNHLEVELYRANPIETFDTVSLRTRFDGGSEMVANLTHACAEVFEPTISIASDRPIAEWRDDRDQIYVFHNGKRVELTRTHDPHQAMAQRLASAATGKGIRSGSAATLDSSLAHTLLIEGISRIGSVVDVPTNNIRTLEKTQGHIHTIEGIGRVFHEAHEKGLMLNELGLLEWTQPADADSLVRIEREIIRSLGPLPSDYCFDEF